MGHVNLQQTPLAGLCLVQSMARVDQRGRFERLYCEQALAPLHPGLRVAQANLSTTRGRGALRGLHYQGPPGLEAKLVRCLHGRVFDVAVDLRAGSATFLRWHAVELAGELSLFIPEGFAHGFQVLSDEAQLLYFHTAAWNPDSEGGLRYDDPALAIGWPLPVTTISARDRAHPLLGAQFRGIPT